jgi:glutamate formiminotransferase/formiminotetrahydrofolate cyclodeaminase
MYLDQPMQYFLDKLASKSPEPGGGSVAALAGSLAAALVSMVANLTLEKEKYLDVQPQIKVLLAESERLRNEMQNLIQQDTEVYGYLSAVYRMPKTTDAEKAVRNVKIQEGLKQACQVPCEIGIKSLDIARLALQAAEIGNTNAVSDSGIAAILAKACAQSAALNVKINLNSIHDQAYVIATWSHMQYILTQITYIEKIALEITYRKMR